MSKKCLRRAAWMVMLASLLFAIAAKGAVPRSFIDSVAFEISVDSDAVAGDRLSEGFTFVFFPSANEYANCVFFTIDAIGTPRASPCSCCDLAGEGRIFLGILKVRNADGAHASTWEVWHTLDGITEVVLVDLP